MLFDDNFGFPNIELYPQKENPKLVTKEVGFVRGNMFKDEYIPYKNYNPGTLNATSERMKLVLDILELCFKKVDLNLYLDLNPDDQELVEEFKKCVEDLCTKEAEYVKKYGPIEVIDGVKDNEFIWVSDPWPWQVGGNRNV